MVNRPLGRGRPPIMAGHICIDTAFVQKYQMFHHLRLYRFLPVFSFFPYIELDHAHLRTGISFSMYNP